MYVYFSLFLYYNNISDRFSIIIIIINIIINLTLVLL